MPESKPKMTVIYASKSNQIWDGQRFEVGEKISAKDFDELPDDKKENFRKIELNVRGFVEDLLNRVDELESKTAALEKFISKSAPTK